MKKGLITVMMLVCLSSLNHSFAQQKRTVHLVGYTDNGGEAAAYWKDGVLTALPVDPGFSMSKAHGIWVNGADVYIVGFESNSSNPTTRYWKNGTAAEIKSAGAFLEDVAVVGSDVYIVGMEYDKKGKRYAQYWKNGVPSPLNKKKTGVIVGITVSGNDVYMVGSDKALEKNSRDYYGDVAAYWKNGTQVMLTNGEKRAFAYDIFVAGNDVYVTGTEANPTTDAAKYWKNGEAFMLTDGKQDATAKGIYVDGTDVYVVGNVVRDNKYVATLWKNGVATDLAPRSTNSGAMKVMVVDGDVYVAGFESVDKKSIARCWKNGIPMELSGGENSVVMALFVQ